MAQPLTGTATGIVDGKRRTMQLTFERTNLPGVVAVRRTWPDEGAWALAITIADHDESAPTALVGIDGGEIRSVKVPTQTKNGHTYGRPVTQRDIDATLQAVTSAGDSGSRDLGLAGAVLLLPIGLGLALRRSR
jgi:hypothetical protein